MPGPTDETTGSGSSGADSPDPIHPYTDKGVPNVEIGVDGNSMLPGDAAKERIRRGKGKRYKGFPKKGKKNNDPYDLERIHQAYLDSPILDWYAYCATKGYNPSVVGLPWKSWVREKKYKNAWRSVQTEIEDAGTNLGPKTLLRALQAVKNVPETLAGMLSICHHAVSIHYDEIREDQKNLKEYQLKGGTGLVPRGTFSASTQDIAILAGAVTKTSQMLYDALGIDKSIGLNPEKWMQIVEEQLSRIDGTNESMAQAEVMEVEVMGASDIAGSLKDAIAKYLDPPRILDTAEEDAELKRAIEGTSAD